MTFNRFPEFEFEAIRGALKVDGAVIVTGLGGREKLLAFCNKLGGVMQHRDSDQQGITAITVSKEASVAAGFGGFSCGPLELHTDRSTITTPPNLMILTCQSQSDLGGELRCVDGKQLYQKLASDAPDILRWATADDQVVYFDGTNIYTGPIFREQADGSVEMRFRCDGRGYYRREHWHMLERFLSFASSVETMVKLKPGESIILNNGRWLHGRTSFQGEREIWRVLVDNRTQFRSGFAAVAS